MINGPSVGENELDAFSFSGKYEGATRHGQPQVYNFNWIEYKQEDSLELREE